MHEFQIIEDKVLEALAPLKASGVRNLDAYGGQLDTEGDLADMVARLDLFPCVYVVASALSSESRNLSDEIAASVALVVADQNSRGAEFAMRGDTRSPGVYSLLEQVKESLHRKNVIPGWKPLEREREYPVIYKPAQGLCVYMAVYRAIKRT
ncbi:phage protein Gp37 [Desulforegula conservatrix]|uniref:phage protein Gp37 n=1 Tax=Desulforegula conservatrix TaxID=153026 RepID=UPI0003FDB21E|nr:phage protein Gp37 [Desulforegula conservatrix]